MSRYFVAMHAPNTIVDYLVQVQDQLRQLLGSNGISWTARDRFHITLQFMPNVQDECVAELIEQLRSCTTYRSFELNLEGLSSFSRRGVPRVLFAQTTYSEQLQQLVACVRSVTERYVVSAHAIGNAFVPHLTLARFKRASNAKRIAEVVEACNLVPHQWLVTEFVLFRSDPDSGRWIHNEVKLFPLS